MVHAKVFCQLVFFVLAKKVVYADVKCVPAWWNRLGGSTVTPNIYKQSATLIMNISNLESNGDSLAKFSQFFSRYFSKVKCLRTLSLTQQRIFTVKFDSGVDLVKIKGAVQ